MNSIQLFNLNLIWKRKYANIHKIILQFRDISTFMEKHDFKILTTEIREDI